MGAEKTYAGAWNLYLLQNDYAEIAEKT